MKKKNEEEKQLKEDQALAQEEAEKGSYMRGHLVTGKKKDMLQVMASQEDEEQQVPSRFKKWPKLSDQQLEFDMAVVMFIVSCNLPFTLVESQGFKNFINYLCPRANIKTRNAFSQWKVPLVFNNLKDDVDYVLKKDLKNCTQMALTTDNWTARNNEPFMSLTLHYVNEAFKLESMSLGCDYMPERHTCKFKFINFFRR